MQKLFDNLPRNYKNLSWLANPPALPFINEIIYPPMRYPFFRVRKFNFIRFKISVLENFDHWRAGIFITSLDKSKDYVFHLYKNKNDPRIQSKMTKRIFSQGHKNESDKNLLVEDFHNFWFELKAEGIDLYSLGINGKKVDQYKVPKEDFKFIEIGAWADNKPYKIKFTNIEFYG